MAWSLKAAGKIATEAALEQTDGSNDLDNVQHHWDRRGYRSCLAELKQLLLSAKLRMAFAVSRWY